SSVATIPTALATSTLYGTAPAGGYVLGWNNATNGIGWIATSSTAGGGITTLGDFYHTGLTGIAQTLSTSTADTNLGMTIVSSGTDHLFTPYWIGQLSIARGGTGLSSVSGNQLLYSNSNGTAFAQVSTSTLSIGGNAATVTTNANLSGVITSSGNTTSYAATAGANTILANATGGPAAPTFVSTSTLNIGGTASNITGIVALLNGGTGLSSITGNRLLYTNSAGTAFAQAATSTLYGTGTGGQILAWNNTNAAPTWTATTTIPVGGGVSGTLSNITVVTNANLSGVVTSSGNTTSFGTLAQGILGNPALTATIPTALATSTLYGLSTGGMVLGWNNVTGGLGFVATSSSSGLSAIGANMVLANNTSASAIPTGVSTSTMFGLSTGGKVLGWDNTTGGIGWVATSSAAGGGYTTITDDTNGSLTQVSTLAFLGTGINCINGTGQTECTVNAGAATAAGATGNIQFNTGNSLDAVTNFTWDKTNSRLGVGSSSPMATLTASSTSALIAAAIIDQRGTGALLSLQQGGLDKFTVANGGGLTISAVTSDTVKSTAGTGKTTDFDYPGATLASTTATSDYVTINDGAVPANGGSIAASTSPTTNVAVGAGGQVILRSDGKYIIIHGGGSATASLWNGFAGGAMSATPTAPATGGTVGAGAIAIKRPDGRYIVFHGGGANLSTVFDPYGITATVAGPVPGGACTTGTNAFLRQNGNYIVLCGGTTGWGVYDPSRPAPGALVAGSAIGGNWGAGAHAVQRDDGTFLVYQGGGTGTFIYNPYNNTMTAGPAAPTAIAAGSFSIRRQDGIYLTLPGSANQSFLYSPVSTTTPNGTGGFSANLGVGPSSALADGAQSVWRQDGKYILITANTTVVNVIDQGAGIPGVTAGAQAPVFSNPGAPLALSAAAGAGITAFMLPNGTSAIVRGGGTGIDIVDTNFVTGTNGANTQDAYYESECIDNTNLSPDSTMNWVSNSEGKISVQVRTVTNPTACSAGTYKSIGNSGDLIGAATANNRIQFKFTFQRELPRFMDQEWGVRKTGQTRYRRVNADPTLYSVVVDNGTALHRTQFDFGNAVSSTTAFASGPVAVNLTNDTNRANALALSVGQSATINQTMTQGTGHLYNGTFNSHNVLTTGTASSTVVMKRPDGKWVVIAGNATPNAQVYDETLQTFTALGTTPTAALGTGGFAFKRPDGKYLIVLGNKTTTTNIYDPVANTFIAGPVLTAAAWIGALQIPLPMGRVLIVHGNLTNSTSIYDPIQNTMTTGPTSVTVVGPGSVVIPRPDGTFLFVPGMSAYPICSAVVTTTQFFNPYTMLFTAAGPTNTGGTGPGAFAFQRQDGQWIIVRGGATASTCASVKGTGVYNPFDNQITTTGPTMATAPGLGAQVLPRPDGTWLMIIGGSGGPGVAQTQTFIYQEKVGALTATGPQSTLGQFTVSSTTITGINSGSVSFQRSDGKFVVITGAATTTTGTVVQVYDAGWVQSGSYKSEQFDLSPVGTKLDANSTLIWKGNMFSTALGSISAEVKTAPTQAALATTSTRTIQLSGSLINPAATDAWLQVAFNFRRAFPSYDGIYTDVWNSGSAMRFAQRPVLTPTLYEYKVTKDKDLLDLQSDGLSILRVSTSGDVFTQVGGTINTSGADLAERYTSQVELQKGSVVAIDPQNNHGVMPSKYQYQSDILGVVSTDPGFVAGAYTENSYPIALIGRVPVNVSTENGMIRTGDYLTAASVPGYAMKAVLSGRVIGKALESLDESKLIDCPASDIYMPNRKCGTVMVFVNLIDYQGQSVDLAMSDWNVKRANIVAAGLATGLDIATSTMPADAAAQFTFRDTRSSDIMNFLESLKAERAVGVTSQSEIFADKISAVSQVISPEIVANIVNAKEGRFGAVDGLAISAGTITADKIITSSISSSVGGFTMDLLPDGRLVMRRVATVSMASTSSTSSEQASSPQAITTDIATSSLLASVDSAFATLASSTSLEQATTTDIVISFDATGNAFFAGEVVAQKVSTGALDVSGLAKFAGGLEVASLGIASSTMAILSDTSFIGRPYFTSDTGGTATIKKGARLVDVTFAREYIETPILTASMVFTASTTDENIDQIFSDDVRYVVTKRTATGFTIFLNKKATIDTTFNWLALAVKDSKEFTSRTVQAEPVAPPVPLSDVVTVSTTTPMTASTTLEVPLLDTSTTTPEAATTTPVTIISLPDTSLTSDVLPVVDQLTPLPQV
ncbi:MAG: hypothetical protein WAW90_00025, partial [Minisyncoccia bacterium]